MQETRKTTGTKHTYRWLWWVPASLRVRRLGELHGFGMAGFLEAFPCGVAADG